MPYVKKLKLDALLVLSRAGWGAQDMALVLGLSRATVERSVVEYRRAQLERNLERLSRR